MDDVYALFSIHIFNTRYSNNTPLQYKNWLLYNLNDYI